MSPILYLGQNKKLTKETIKEFSLNIEEQKLTQGTSLHKFDHVKQNVRIAANIGRIKEIKQYNKINVISKLQ